MGNMKNTRIRFKRRDDEYVTFIDIGVIIDKVKAPINRYSRATPITKYLVKIDGSGEVILVKPKHITAIIDSDNKE